jgi:hypothetical protein
LLQFEVVRAFCFELPGDTPIRYRDVYSEGTTSDIATRTTSNQKLSPAAQSRLPEKLRWIDSKRVVRKISQQIDAVDYWPHLMVIRVW